MSYMKITVLINGEVDMPFGPSLSGKGAWRLLPDTLKVTAHDALRLMELAKQGFISVTREDDKPVNYKDDSVKNLMVPRALLFGAEFPLEGVKMDAVKSGRTSCKEPNTSAPPRGQRVPGPGLYDNPPSKYSRAMKEEADTVVSMAIHYKDLEEEWRKVRIGGTEKLVNLRNKTNRTLYMYPEEYTDESQRLEFPPSENVVVDLSKLTEREVWTVARGIRDGEWAASWPPAEEQVAPSTPSCECGMAACGGSHSSGPGHSRWCPVFTE
jgi:hypothetical protein